MKIAIHAGHNPDGMIACGAVKYGKESTLAREVTFFLEDYLDRLGEVEYKDVTVDDGKNQNDILTRLVKRINEYNPDLSISIHLNSSGNDIANGAETWVNSKNPYMKRFGDEILKKIYGHTSLNIRSTKSGKKLAVIDKVKCDAILIECAFVSSRSDMNKFNSRKIAKSIFLAIKDFYDLEEKN